MQHFNLSELVDKHTFETMGEKAWTLFSPDLLEALEGIRTLFNAPVTVNNWDSGGPFQYRGYRPPECTVGAEHSYHRQGMAFDCDIVGSTARQARSIILANQNDPHLIKIQRMEADVSWLHFDVGQIPKGKQRIYVFKG